MEKIRELMIEKYVELTDYEPESVAKINWLLSDVCKDEFTRDQIIFFVDGLNYNNKKIAVVFTTEALCVKASEQYSDQYIAYYKDIDIISLEDISFQIIMRDGQRYEYLYEIDTLLRDKMKELVQHAVYLFNEDPRPDPEKFRELMIKKFTQLTEFPPNSEVRLNRLLNLICQKRFNLDEIVFFEDNSSDVGYASNYDDVNEKEYCGYVFTTEALCIRNSDKHSDQIIAYFKDIESCDLIETEISKIFEWGGGNLFYPKEYDIILKMRDGKSFVIDHNKSRKLKGQQFKDLVDYLISITAQPDQDETTAEETKPERDISEMLSDLIVSLKDILAQKDAKLEKSDQSEKDAMVFKTVKQLNELQKLILAWIDKQ